MSEIAAIKMAIVRNIKDFWKKIIHYREVEEYW